jgi:uncharacterized protein YaaW (UPF0174 family)
MFAFIGEAMKVAAEHEPFTFVDEPSHLAPLLRVADKEDLDILVDYLTDQGVGRISLADDVCRRLVSCKASGEYSEADRTLIAAEIRLFGGNTLVNLFRGDGVPYIEVVRDVARHLKVNFSEDAEVPLIEDGILRKLLDEAFAKMTDEERQKVLDELNVKNLSALGPAGTAAALGAAKFAGFATYKIALIVANAVAKAILGRGLSLATNAAITRALGVALGPIGWVITGLWTIADFASPAYRVTVPCIVQIAYIRQKALIKLHGATCPTCNAVNLSGAKFCSNCGTPMVKTGE